MKDLTERRNSFTTTAERDVGRDVKEKLCYITFDFDTELKSTGESSDKKQTFEHPEGNILTVGVKRFHCVKVFFQPSFTCKEASGVHDTSFHHIMKCVVNIRQKLYTNVVLSGRADHVLRDWCITFTLTAWLHPQ